MLESNRQCTVGFGQCLEVVWRMSGGCLGGWEGVVGDYERQLKVLVINMLDQAQNLEL